LTNKRKHGILAKLSQRTARKKGVQKKEKNKFKKLVDK